MSQNFICACFHFPCSGANYCDDRVCMSVCPRSHISARAQQLMKCATVFGHNKRGPKGGELLCPFSWGSWVHI